MAKCLVGANGGGKVTVAGLSADVVLTGKTVAVKQGAKIVESIVGGLEVLSWCGRNNSGNGWYWNGSSYARNIGSHTFSGTPMLAVGCNGPQLENGPFLSFNLCGHDITNNYSPIVVIPKNNTISVGVGIGKNTGSWVVLGKK